MAKKPRTPPPPRKVQAPKQRHASRAGLDPARRRTILYGLAAAGLVGLVIVLIVILAGGNSSNPGKVAAAMRAAGCTLQTTPAGQNVKHIAQPTQVVTYDTYPAVSGIQHPQPAIWGDYTQPVDPRQAAHNQEHGGMIVWVGPGVSPAERKKISAFYDGSPDGILVTAIENSAQYVKYPKHAPPGSKIYLTAWRAEIKGGKLVKGTNEIATCPRFNEKAFAAFRNEFRGTGPERSPVSSLKPGT